METKPAYFSKRKAAFKYAFKGVVSFFRREAHAKLHLAAAILAITFGFIFDICAYEWIAICVCIAMVLAAEAINSAIEILTDSIYKEQHPWAAKIKDISAGAVLICAIMSVIVAAIIFVPYFLKFIKQ